MRDLLDRTDERSDDGTGPPGGQGGGERATAARRDVLVGAGGLAALAFGGVMGGYLGGTGGSGSGGQLAAIDSSAFGLTVEDPAFERHVDAHDLPEPPTLEDVGTTRTRDAVADLGLDPNGNDPIQGAVDDALRDGDRIEFPDGTYRLSGPLRISGRSNFALVGTGDASFVLDSGLTQNVLSYRNCRDGAFVGIDIDQSADDCSAQTGFNAEGALVVKDVEFVGYSDPDDSGKKVGFNVRDPNGAARFENVVATDGTEVGRDGVDHNNVHKQQYDGAFWAGPPHEGTAYFIDCAAANWSDNGLYASRTNGGIVVLGGYFANSSISQVRLGHPASFVGGGCRIVVDREEIPAANNPDGLAFTRGVWLESGSLNNPGATVGRCNIRVGDVDSFGGCIRVSDSAANARIEGLVEVIAPGSVDRLNASPSVQVTDGAIQDVDAFSDDAIEDPDDEIDLVDGEGETDSGDGDVDTGSADASDEEPADNETGGDDGETADADEDEEGGDDYRSWCGLHERNDGGFGPVIIDPKPPTFRL